MQKSKIPELRRRSSNSGKVEKNRISIEPTPPKRLSRLPKDDAISSHSLASEGSSKDMRRNSENPDSPKKDISSREFYEEIVFQTVHRIGRGSLEFDNASLFAFIQKAFKITPDVHNKVVLNVKKKKPRSLNFNIDVIEAKDLTPMDANGLSDPFVSLYFESNESLKRTSAIKLKTLNPQFDEQFIFEISNNANEETLMVKVWDFDEAESISEKMNNLGKVQDLRGFRKFMTDVTTKALSDKDEEEYIGGVKIPIKNVPVVGVVDWFNLRKKGDKNLRGQIKLQLSFTSKKNPQKASQEHRQLLEILLRNELASPEYKQQCWAGKFVSIAESVIAQHQGQSGLTEIDAAFAQLSSFVNVHQDQPISFEVFDKILDVLAEPIKTEKFNGEEDLLRFSDSIKLLLPSCFKAIMNLHGESSDDSATQLKHALSIIAKVIDIKPPSDLFDTQFYEWLDKGTTKSFKMLDLVSQAVNCGTLKYYESFSALCRVDNDSDELQVKQFSKLVQSLQADVLLTYKYYDDIFKDSMGFLYPEAVFKIYDQKLTELMKPVVKDICENRTELPTLLNSDEMEPADKERYEEVNQLLTSLFELYMLLKEFLDYGTAVCSENTEILLKDYPAWFSAGIGHWIDVSVYKAETRIRKAVELDSLVTVDANVKYSSSAVDAMSIFYQISKFWEQLGLPNTEASAEFFSKIAKDIDSCCELYVDQMAMRASALCKSDNPKVTTEWCTALNNIDYIRENIDEFMKKLAMVGGKAQSAKHIEDSVKVVESVTETSNKKNVELCLSLTEKMSPEIKRLLVAAADHFEKGPQAMDRFMGFMEDSFKEFDSNLSPQNFAHCLTSIWAALSRIIHEHVMDSVDNQRSPKYFANLKAMLSIMIENFSCPEVDPNDNLEVEAVKKLLEFNSMESYELIHLYYNERYAVQKSNQKGPNGILTVRCYFTKEALEVEIINGKNLTVMDTNGQSDPYVTFDIFPEIDGLNVSNFKTKVHKETLFPMFDEKFSVPLTEDQRSKSEKLIVFSVYDMDCMGLADQFMANAFLKFGDIPEASPSGEKPKALVNMVLSRPEDEGKFEASKEILQVLKTRRHDDFASNFINELNTRSQINKRVVKPKNACLNIFRSCFAPCKSKTSDCDDK